MTTKIINLDDYKHRRVLKNLKREIDAMSDDYKYALVNGICDFCNIAASDVRKFKDHWCCDGCVPDMAQEDA